MSNWVCLILYFILLLSTPAQLRTTCTKALDVVFLLDSGPDIPDDDWNYMSRLAQNIAYNLYPSIHGSHIAQVQFGGNTSIVHGLSAERVITYRSESLQTGRNVFDAINTTRRLVLNNTAGDRPEVPDVIVLITGGLSDDRKDAIAEASKVKSEGVRIITVGITSTGVDELREELRHIATDPGDVENLMLISPNYYSPVYSALLRTVCRHRVEATNGSIRLVDGNTNAGRLEVYIQEEWVTVCGNGWTDQNTRIACEQLRFQDGQGMYTMNQTFYHRRTGIANIQCSGNESSLLHCPHDPFFNSDPICDHRQDVFLRCLCSECNDYIPRDNIRLEDRTPISGRLEVFSPRIGWGGVCSSGWTTSNTRVACRQFGFLDGAGTYRPDHGQSMTFALFNVRCSGNESSLFDCTYSTTSVRRCTDPIHIRCECNRCPKSLLQESQQKDATKHSTEVFEWRFKHNVSDFEILFLSQKNPQTLVYVEKGKVIKENTRFKHRIQLINDSYETVGFNLTNITVADMGIYSLYVPELLLSSNVILIVTDFAVVPDAVINRQIHESVQLSWDLTALRQLGDINHEIFLTTPATGRLHLEHYYSRWLRDNPNRHRIPQPPAQLHPTIIIDDVTAKDAGNYVIEVVLMTSVHQWLNSSWQLATELVVADTVCQTSNTVLFIATIVLGILLGISIIAIIVLMCLWQKRTYEVRKLKNRTRRDKRRQTTPVDRQHTQDDEVNAQQRPLNHRNDEVSRQNRPPEAGRMANNDNDDDRYNENDDDYDIIETDINET